MDQYDMVEIKIQAPEPKNICFARLKLSKLKLFEVQE